MTGELARVEVRDTSGVFAARQLGREAAAELGLDRQDQVRVATALSEVGRELVAAGQEATMTFLAAGPELVIRVEHGGPAPAAALAAAARLLDRVPAAGAAARRPGTLELAKRRPPGAGTPDLAAARRRLAALPGAALDELRRQNEDLIGALGELQGQREDLLRLNAELEETNRGVLALYKELSAELEETNRGVVALYAELEEKSERLREASEAKDRFWANVSHELRSPLNSIIGLARLLGGPGSELDEEQRRQVALITSSGTGLLTLVNDLLDTAKAESGRLQAEPAVTDLPAVLRRLRALLRPMTENRPVSLVMDLTGAPADLLTDEVALTAILRNLLSNGLKYTDAGEVRLSVTTGDGHVDIVVADTGIGIPGDLAEQVFEEFFQVPGTRRGGTGLGLPYARRLAGLLGGRLALASEPGRGTTVTLRLPYGTPALATVLVADDDADFRRALRGLLDGIAGRVIEAADGAAALAALEGADRPEGLPDLALIDLRMPGTDGYALAERLPPGIPVIAITSADAPAPPRASALIRKDQLTAERLVYTINRIRGVDDG